MSMKLFVPKPIWWLRTLVKGNVIVLHEAPREILRDLRYLEDRFPGVEITQKRGGIWIDCEHIVLEKKEATLSGRLRELVGCAV